MADLITTDQVEEWTRIDFGTDQSTIAMLIGSAADVIEHETGIDYRNSEDSVPESIQHAAALFVSAHFNDRDGADDAAMVAVRRLCAPFRVARL